MATRNKALDLEDKAASIRAAWDHLAQTERSHGSEPHPYVYASQIHECGLRMLRDMVEPQVRPPISADGLHRMRLGVDREVAIRGDLERIGRNHEPRFELEDRGGRREVFGRYDPALASVPVIRGKGEVDLVWSHDRSRTPLEIKCWAPHVAERIRCFADLFHSRWTANGARQMLAYMEAAGAEEGIFVLDCRTGPKLLPVRRAEWAAEIEVFIRRAESAVSARQAIEERWGIPGYRPDGENAATGEIDRLAGTLPYSSDPTECASCDYCGRTCLPPLVADRGKQLQVCDDPGALEDVEIEVRDRETAKRWERAHDRLAERFRGIQAALVGDYVVGGKWRSRTITDLPEKVKVKRKAEDERYKRVLPEGTWIWSASSLVAPNEEP